MILVFVTELGRHVTDEDIARDAAECLIGERGVGGNANQLARRVDHYSEGHPLPESVWRFACDRYADAFEAHQLAVDGPEPCRLERIRRAEAVAAIRNWQMPPSLARATKRAA